MEGVGGTGDGADGAANGEGDRTDGLVRSVP